MTAGAGRAGIGTPGKAGDGLPVTISELAFDLTTKNGQALEETVVRLLQRGGAGLQTVLRACSDPSSEGRVRAAVSGASARVAEAFAALPAKAREGTGLRLLELLRPEVLEAKGYEVLRRGAEEPARQFAQVLAAREGFAAAALRLETACAMHAGDLAAAVSLAGRQETGTGADLVAMLLAQGRRFSEAAGELGGARRDHGGAARVLAAVLDLLNGGAIAGDAAVAGFIDQLAASGRDDLRQLGQAAVEEFLSLWLAEAKAAGEAVVAALRALAETFGRVEEAGRQAGPANWIDGVGAAGLPGALTEAVDRLREALAPYAPVVGEPVDLGAAVEEATGGATARVAGSAQVVGYAEPWMAVTALRRLLAEAGELAGAGTLSLAVTSADEGGQAGPTIRVGTSEEAAAAARGFHPLLTGPDDGLPSGAARSFRLARRLLAAFGGDVHWAPAPPEGDRRAPRQWAVEVVFAGGPGTAPRGPAATAADDRGAGEGADLRAAAAGVAGTLASPGSGRAFAAALRAASSDLAGWAIGDIVTVADAELTGLGETARALSGALRGPAGDEPGGPEAVSRAAGSARRRVQGILTRLGRGGEQADAYGDLNEVVSTALGEVEPVARGLGAGLVFLPAVGLPRPQLDRGLVAAAVTTLAEEALRVAGRGGEVRVTVTYRGDEAIAELRVESPTVTPFSPLAEGLAAQVAARHGGTLSLGPHGTDVAIGFTVSDEERRLARSLPGYARLSAESRRALRTAEAVAAAPSAADPGLRPFLWFKAAELETKVRLVTGLQRHRYLPAALDALEGGRSRLSRAGEARLAAVAAALPDEDPRLLRSRLVTATEAVTGDRFERVTGDLRSLGVFVAAYGLPGVARSASSALGRSLFKLGGTDPAAGPDPDVSRAALQALLALETSGNA